MLRRNKAKLTGKKALGIQFALPLRDI